MPFRSLIIGLALSTAALAGDLPLIVGHRGAAHDSPENTLASFEMGFEQGADAVEGDFYLTSDGKIICIHDKDTQRTAGQKYVIVETPFETLRTLDVGAWKAPSFAGQTMPTLLEILVLVPQDKYFVIEIKCGPEIIPQLQKDIATSGLQPQQMRIISFNDEVIRAARKAMPAIDAYWLTSFKQHKATGQWSPTQDEVLATLERVDATGLDCKAEPAVVDAAFVKALRAGGYEFHVWTVDEPDLARQMADLGVDSITTNRPAFLRKAMTAGE